MSKIAKIKKYYNENGLKDTVSWLNGSVKIRIEQHKNAKKIDFSEVILTKEEKKGCILKETPQVFIFATVPFYDVGGGQRSAQEAKIFNKMGYRVNYIYAYKSSEKMSHTMEIPTCKHLFIEQYTVDNFRKDLKNEDIVIFEAPHIKFKPYVHASSKAKLIYENIDNWESSLVPDNFHVETLKLLLEKSKLLIATSKALQKQTEDYLKKYKIPNKEVLYLANAVDEEIFAPLLEYKKPKDLITGKKTL